jgi:hypothetical protein
MLDRIDRHAGSLITPGSADPVGGTITIHP